jgi:hypothetical protein
MSQKRRRYVGRAVAGVGWRIWDNKLQRFWGQVYDPFPQALLDELNGEKRPQSLTLLANLLRLKKWRGG